ncbi:MAG: porin family protein [Bacteroidota bacterium]|nr:porin family protein [Bacteroidota bacterium]
MYKKYIPLLFGILVISGYQANAQRIRLGVFANPSISWFKSDVSKVEADGARMGFDVGLMVDKFFAEHYAFTSGLSIHSMGGTINYHDPINLRTNEGTKTLRPNSLVKYHLQYLHIPLGIKMRTTEIGYFTYFAQLGLDPMINVKANASFTDNTNTAYSNAGVGDEINTFYLAYHASAGLEYKLAESTSLFAGLTYMNGVSDITDNSGSTTEKTVMHGFSLRLGILF